MNHAISSLFIFFVCDRFDYKMELKACTLFSVRAYTLLKLKTFAFRSKLSMKLKAFCISNKLKTYYCAYSKFKVQETDQIYECKKL